MSKTRSVDTDISANPRKTAGEKVAGWLVFAASPTFAIMALLTSEPANRPQLLHSAPHTAPLSGMVTMYLLMAILHAAPWLKLLLDGRGEGMSKQESSR